MHKTAIIIVALNNLQYTKLTLESIFKNTTDNLYHLFLVNNGSQDDTKSYFDQLLQDKPDLVTVIHSEVNLGFAGGNNLALKEVYENPKYDHVLLLNNDVLVGPYWLSELHSTISRTGAGLVGPVSNSVGGRQLSSSKVKPEDFDTFAIDWWRKNQCKHFEIGKLMGLCLLMKREVLDNIGLLDEAFGKGMWEDNDYCLRAYEAGYKMFVSKGTYLYHFGSQTIKNFDSYQLFHHNKEVFINKWAKIHETDTRKKIVGMLRVKNGGTLLKKVLEAVSKMVDEIVVFDDHSEDNTVDICRSFSKVVDIKASTYTDKDEGRDRGEVFNMAKARQPDWIFAFDSDEEPSQELIRDIQKIVNNSDPEAKLYCFKICHLWNSEKTLRTDGLWGNFLQGRLFKVEPNHSMGGVGDDGYHSGSHPFFSVEHVRTIPYRIKHYGNMNPQVRLKKYLWYTATDKDKDVNAILGGWKDFYRDLYQKIENEKPENLEHPITDYELKDKDYYRHIVNENTLRLAEYRESSKISLPMIVNAEDYKYLSKSLGSVKDFVDEIILVQTDSEKTPCDPNLTKDILGKITWYDFKWTDSFSDARNFALSKCTGDYILRLDADEEVPEPAKQVLWHHIFNDTADAYMVNIHNLLPSDHKSKQKYALSKTIRFWKANPLIKFSGRVHEEIDASLEILSKVSDFRIFNLEYPFYHYGYLKGKEDLDTKYDYYAKLALLDLKDNPTDYKPYFNLAVHYFHINELDKAETYYKGSLALKPHNWTAQHDLGVVLYKKALMKVKKDLQEARELFSLALKGVPKDADDSYVTKLNHNLQSIESILRSIQTDEKE